MEPEDNVRILVLGGTGHYGRHIVSQLVAKGAKVRVLSRSVERARGILGSAPEVLAGDITDPVSLSRALEGADGIVVSISAVNRKQIRRAVAIERDGVIAALRTAEKRHVQRVVVISTYDVRRDVGSPPVRRIAAAKLAVEEYLARSSLNWTVLGAPPSQEIFFAMTRGKTMIVPGGGPPALPTISPLDLGEVAAQAVLRTDLAGLRVRVVGPETLGFAEAARRLSAVYGHPITFRRIPLFPFRLGYWLTWPLAPFFDLALYLNTMLGFIRLMNQFPQDVAAEAAADHRRLRSLFDLATHSLEAEASRRLGRHP
jgi:uncharacterized protein YbjT (DUF2867 family)